MLHEELGEFTCVVLLQVLFKVGHFHLAAWRLRRANHIIDFALCRLIAAFTPESTPSLNVTAGTTPVTPPFLKLPIHASFDPTTGCNPPP